MFSRSPTNPSPIKGFTKAAAFYFLNGHEFGYDHEIRSILKSFGADERAVDEQQVRRYLERHTKPIDLEAEIDEWREDLIERGLDRLEDLLDGSDESSK